MAASLHYVRRDPVYLEDNGMYDDVLLVEFDAAKVNYPHFTHHVFSMFVRYFRAYRGTVILDDDLDREDGDRVAEQSSKTGKDPDGRDGVYRIGPVNFFDRELCSRAFGLSPEAVANALRGKAERVEVVADGVLIVMTTNLLDRRGLELIQDSAGKCLATQRPLA